MSGNRGRSLLAASVAAGAVSALLFHSLLLSLAFLVPVQVAFGRHGRRAGFGAAAAAILAVVVGHVLRAAFAGVSALAELGPADFLAVAAPPAVLVGALCLMNLSFWDGKPGVLRGLAAVSAASLVAVPAMMALGRDAGFTSFLEARLDAVFKPLLAQAGEGYDSAALKAALDPKVLSAQTTEALVSSVAALLLALLAASWWIGNRLAGPGTPGREAARPLADYRLPYVFVWPFLAAWTGVLAVAYLEAPAALRAIAWNLALVLSLAYAAQGIGIASHLMNRWKLPRSLRIALGATAVMVFATPPVGTLAALILPLLGVTEVWIPYRNLKGVGA